MFRWEQVRGEKQMWGLKHSILYVLFSQVQVYSPTSLQIHKTISRFKEVAYSGSFRSDGKLLVAGGDEGSVRLFDVDSKSLLRLFKGHSGWADQESGFSLMNNVHIKKSNRLGSIKEYIEKQIIEIFFWRSAKLWFII